jgi:hypothetical protein
VGGEGRAVGRSMGEGRGRKVEGWVEGVRLKEERRREVVGCGKSWSYLLVQNFPKSTLYSNSFKSVLAFWQHT